MQKMTIVTKYCEICKDVPPYAKCSGDGCARLATRNTELLALIEFVRNHAAGSMRTGVMGSKEYCRARLECADMIDAMGCYEMLTKWAGKETPARPVCERGEAVNLATNVIESASTAKVTAKGISILCQAVLVMDKYIRGLK